MERATLSSSPATSKVRRDRLVAAAMSSSPASSDKDEVEQHFRTKAAAQISVTLYVFAKVTNHFPTTFSTLLTPFLGQQRHSPDSRQADRSAWVLYLIRRVFDEAIDCIEIRALH